MLLWCFSCFNHVVADCSVIGVSNRGIAPANRSWSLTVGGRGLIVVSPPRETDCSCGCVGDEVEMGVVDILDGGEADGLLLLWLSLLFCRSCALHCSTQKLRCSHSCWSISTSPRMFCVCSVNVRCMDALWTICCVSCWISWNRFWDASKSCCTRELSSRMVWMWMVNVPIIVRITCVCWTISSLNCACWEKMTASDWDNIVGIRGGNAVVVVGEVRFHPAAPVSVSAMGGEDVARGGDGRLMRALFIVVGCCSGDVLLFFLFPVDCFLLSRNSCRLLFSSSSMSDRILSMTQ